MIRGRCFLILPILLLLACTPREEQPEGSDTLATGAPPTMEQWPDTTAEAVWGYLQAQGYQSWPMWPGKAALYQGREPHGALLTTYVNRLTQDALTNGSARLPDHAIIVKENYLPDSSLAAVTVMYKVAGYDAAHGDWFWLKRLADGTVEASGRVQPCFACHGGQAANDYIMTGRLATGGTAPN